MKGSFNYSWQILISDEHHSSIMKYIHKAFSAECLFGGRNLMRWQEKKLDFTSYIGKMVRLLGLHRKPWTSRHFDFEVIYTIFGFHLVHLSTSKLFHCLFKIRSTMVIKPSWIPNFMVLFGLLWVIRNQFVI